MVGEITEAKDVLNFAERLGVVLNKDSTQLLLNNSDWKNILEELANEGNFFITTDILEKKINITKLSSVVTEVEVKKASLLLKPKTEHLILE